MKEVIFELERCDYDAMHDTVLEALLCDHEILTDEFLQSIFEKLPHRIKAEAYKWGLDDTCVRDEIYVYLQENKSEN